MKSYIITAAILLGMGSIIGAFFYGRHVQAGVDRAASVSASADYFIKQVEKALTVNDIFSNIGRDLANKQGATEAAAIVRTVYIDRVIHEKPLPAVCALDPELVRMRCESRQALYRAAGQPVPGECPRDPAAAAPPPGQ